MQVKRVLMDALAVERALKRISHEIIENNKGVKNVVIMDGRVPHSILMELLTDEGAGTMVSEK